MTATKGAHKVSVIVVNWNGAELLQACLNSLLFQAYEHLEIILVDNGSSDDSVRRVTRTFPQVKLLELDSNKGFTGGNWAGLQVAKGEFIALVNNDTRAEQDWLERLLQPMINDPLVGICASKIIIEGTDRIDSVGEEVTTAGVGFSRGLGKNKKNFVRLEPVFGVCGAAALCRRKMLDEIGFFDDDFFLYDEDIDLSFRAQLAGWKCMYVPGAVVHHKGNATSVRLSDLHVYYHNRNLELVWIKNMPTGLMLRFMHHKLIQELGSFCYLCLRHMKWRAFFRAKRDALKMLPVMLEKRKQIQARKRVSNKYIRTLLTSVFSPAMIRQKIVQLIKG